jgi:hypothetical protein
MLFSKVLSPFITGLVLIQCTLALPMDDRHISSRANGADDYGLVGRAPDPFSMPDWAGIRSKLHQFTKPKTTTQLPADHTQDLQYG